MITFVIGTTAEAIKLKALWEKLESEKSSFQIVNLGQHSSNLRELCALEYKTGKILELRKTPYRDLGGSFEALLWFFSMLFNLIKFFKSNERITAVIVQGDTLSTLIGALAARLCQIRIFHIEAGLRSFKLFHPFPEEISRRIVSKLSFHNFCPSKIEVKNLLTEGISGNQITETFGNTSFDNLPGDVSPISETEKFILVTLHRHELLSNRKKLREILYVIETLSQKIKVYVFFDSRAMKLSKELWEPSNHQIVLLSKMPRDDFFRYLLAAEWVLTDSGGLQEECAFLGIPTIIFRKATERFDRVGQNIFLAQWNIQNVIDFSENYKKHRISKEHLLKSPSLLIYDTMRKMKVLN